MSRTKAGLIFLTVLTLRCATVTSGSTERISIASEPAGATATITCGGNRVGTVVTPASIAVPRRAKACELTLFRDGYEPELRILNRRVSGKVAANALGGVVPGLSLGRPTLGSVGVWLAVTAGLGLVYGGVATTIDFATGAAYRHNPGTFRVTLRRTEPAR
jgi:hypothetical protein